MWGNNKNKGAIIIKEGGGEEGGGGWGGQGGGRKLWEGRWLEAVKTVKHSISVCERGRDGALTGEPATGVARLAFDYFRRSERRWRGTYVARGCAG